MEQTLLKTSSPVDRTYRTERMKARKRVGERDKVTEIVIDPICAQRHLILVLVGEPTVCMRDTDVHVVSSSSEVKWLQEEDRRKHTHLKLFILREDF